MTSIFPKYYIFRSNKEAYGLHPAQFSLSIVTCYIRTRIDKLKKEQRKSKIEVYVATTLDLEPAKTGSYSLIVSLDSISATLSASSKSNLSINCTSLFSKFSL